MTVAQGADIPKVTPREVAASFTEKKPVAMVAKVTQAEIDNTKNLREAVAKSGGRNVSVEMARQNLDARNEQKQWAGQKGSEVADRFVRPEFKSEVEEKVNKINTVRQALEIINLTPAQQTTRFAELQTAGLIDPTVPNSAKLIKDACTLLITDPSFAVCFPDGMDPSLTPVQREEWVKQGIATNPNLRMRLSEAMGAWQERVLQFADVPQTERAKLETQKTHAESKKTTSKASLDAMIGPQLAGATPTAEQKAALDTLLESGNQRDVIATVLEIRGVTASEQAEINTYTEAQKRIAQINKDITEGRTTATKAKTELEKLTGIAAPAKLAEYQSVAGVVESSSFKLQLDTHRQSTQDVQTLTDKISTTPETDQEKAARFKREAQERSAVDDLDTVISKAMYDAYVQREDDIIAGKQVEAENAAKKAVEAGQLDEAHMYGERDKRRIEKAKDGNPEIVHLGNIRTEINYFRQHGKPGIHVQMARDAGLVKSGGTESYTINGVSKTSGELFDAITSGNMSAREILAFLNSEPGMSARLTALTSKDGIVADYRDTLMLSYVRARRYLKTGGVGRTIAFGAGKIKLEYDGFEDDLKDKLDFFGSSRKFDLRPNEWADLFDQFGGDIEGGIKKDKDGLAFYKKMKDMGVASEPTLKKWLYLLSLLGLIAAPLTAAGWGVGLAASAPGIGAAIGGGLGAAGITAKNREDLIQ